MRQPPGLLGFGPEWVWQVGPAVAQAVQHDTDSLCSQAFVEVGSMLACGCCFELLFGGNGDVGDCLRGTGNRRICVPGLGWNWHMP